MSRKLEGRIRLYFFKLRVFNKKNCYSCLAVTGYAFGANKQKKTLGILGSIKKEVFECNKKKKYIYFRFYRNYKLMNSVKTPVDVVSENGIGVFMA